MTIIEIMYALITGKKLKPVKRVKKGTSHGGIRKV